MASILDSIFTDGSLSIEGFVDAAQELPLHYNRWWTAVYPSLVVKLKEALVAKFAVNKEKISIGLAPANDFILSTLNRFDPAERIVVGNIFDRNPDKPFPMAITSYNEAYQTDIDCLVIISDDFGDEIEQELLRCRFPQEKILNFSSGFLKIICLSMRDKLRQKARFNYSEIKDDLLSRCADPADPYLEDKLKSYLFFWLLESYCEFLHTDLDDSVNYRSTMADFAAGRANYQKAEEPIDVIIHSIDRFQTNTLNAVGFILTNRCNLRCSHCQIYSHNAEHYQSHMEANTELSGAQVVTIIKNSKLLHAAPILFTGGEIFLRDDLKDMFSEIADLGIKFRLGTNGTFPGRLEKLLSDSKICGSILSIGFSLDGDEETHDLIRGKGCYAKLLHSIEVAKAHNIGFSLQSTIQAKNIDRLESFSSFGREVGALEQKFRLEEQQGRYIPIDDLQKIKKFYSDRSDLYYKIINQSIYRGAGCMAGINKCNIMPEGTVETCAMSREFENFDGFVLGDLFDFDLKFDELWFSKAANQARYRLKGCPGCASACER